MSPFLEYILASVALGMVFLFGCVGETITEKAGHLNLGIPGIMCTGGACGCVALKLMYKTALYDLATSVKLSELSLSVDSCLTVAAALAIVFIAILASFGGGILMGMIYSFLTVTLKANQNVTGLAMTIFGSGVTKLIMSGMATTSHQYLYARKFFLIPFSEKTSALKYFGVMVYIAIAIALAAGIVLMRTRVGLRLRSVGESPATADAVGVNVTAYKYIATCVGSGIAALGGLFYIMDYMGSNEAYKSIEALGWLAVALVIFTLWKPHISIVGSVIFGMLYLAGAALPTLLEINLPTYAIFLFEMLPYVVTIVVLIITSVRKKRENQPPASLGLPYFREDR